MWTLEDYILLLILLQALEALVLRCPTEIDIYLSEIIGVGNKFIKYDPVCSNGINISFGICSLGEIQNYAGDDDDEDEEMVDADDDGDDQDADE